MTKPTLEDRVKALEDKVGPKTIENQFQEQAELIDRLFDVRFREHVEMLEERFAEVKSGIGGLKTDVGGLKTDVTGLKTDVAGLKSDVGDLKTDVGDLKTDVAQLQRDMTIVREGVGIILNKLG